VETFVDWMNQRAQELGMKDTHFANPNGLDEEDHYSTAYDMALLAQAVLENETLREIVATKSIQVAGRSLTNHNKLLWRYEGCTGMKTGYTISAGRTLVSCAAREGQTLICVTLKDPNDWEDHSALFDYGFETWSSHLLARCGKTFRTLPVTGSLLTRVGVETAADVTYPLASDERVRVVVTLPEQVTAPVQKGTIAGRLTFYVEGQPVGETYLLYQNDIPDNTPGKTLLQRWKGLFHGGEKGCLSAVFF
jgi:D-alanyl-D-alanine carboxypeptidase